MIIITENKKQHYIIKKFLTEISKVDLNESYQDDIEDRERHYVGEWPIVKDEDFFDNNTEIITQNQPITMQQLKKAAKVKPKMQNLAKLVKSGIAVSILAASSYFASDLNNNKVTQDIAKDNNIPVEKVIQASPQINDSAEIDQMFPTPRPQFQDDDDSISQTAPPEYKDDTSVQQSQRSSLIEKSKERIKEFEGFKPYPYKDDTGVSIGYGTFFIDNVSPDNLPDDWMDHLYEKCEISKKEKSKYETQTQSELEKEFGIHIDNQKSNIDIVLERVSSKIKLKKSELKKWKKIKNKAKRKRYTSVVESEIKRLEKRRDNLKEQKSKLDKEKKTAKSRGFIPESLAKECLSSYVNQAVKYHTSSSSIFGSKFYSMDEDVQTVVIDMSYNIGIYFLTEDFPNFKTFLELYVKAINDGDNQAKSDALKNMWEEIKDRSPEYHAQQSSNKRAEKNTNLLKLAYERSLSKVNENLYSLKTAYKILYN